MRACRGRAQTPMTFREEVPLTYGNGGRIGAGTPSDPGGPCHAASLSAVRRATVAARGDVLLVRVLWISGWPDTTRDPGTAGAHRITIGISRRAALRS